MKRVPRQPSAVAAMGRNGGPMKDRRQPRGGARNDQADLLEEAVSDRPGDEAPATGEQDGATADDDEPGPAEEPAG